MTNHLVLTDIFGTPFTLVDKRREVENAANSIFEVKPYLQLGLNFAKGELVLFFHTTVKGKDWLVQLRQSGTEDWLDARLSRASFKLSSGKKHFRYRAELTGLVPGATFEYRIAKSWTLVHSGSFTAPAINKSRVAIFGDFGDGGTGSLAIASAVYKSQPDLIVMPGDIVYDRGLVSEYLDNFFPICNSETLPLLGTVPLAPAVGNHDIGTPKQVEDPHFDDVDALGCFKFFETPESNLAVGKRHLKEGLSKRRAKLVDVLPKGFMRKANYAFNYGPIFFLMLDANIYMDWTRKKLKRWVAEQLNSAPSQSWKVVVFHQAAFNTDYKYENDQHMRVLCEVFEDNGVSMVFSGHCHYYERSRPLRYKLATGQVEDDGTVKGTVTYEQDHQSPGAITYVISGVGGKLVGSEHAPKRGEHTAVLDVGKNSFSLLEADGEKLVFRQLDVHGSEIDRLEYLRPIKTAALVDLATKV